MEIQNNGSNTTFGQIYVTSNEAQKLLKKADRIIKANPNVNYINTNIPEGHSKPLWSVFSNAIKERQAKNPNNIIIELADKVKQLLTVKTLDNKGFTKSSYTVSPLPKFGTHNEIFPTDDMYRNYYHSLDTKCYGKSELLDILDRAEYEVDNLLSDMPQEKIKPEALPKMKTLRKPADIILNPRRIEKTRRKIVLHTQKPFENLKSMLAPEQAPEKPIKSKKEKLPRKLKKSYQKMHKVLKHGDLI